MVHDHNPVRKCQRLSLIVSNMDHRATDLLAIALNLQLHTLPQFEIKRAKRFVHEQHSGLENDCPRKRNSLTLTARQLAGHAVLIFRKVHKT